MWQKIPEQLDILLTHGPPLGRGDATQFGNRAGCVDLLHIVQQKTPRVGFGGGGAIVL